MFICLFVCVCVVFVFVFDKMFVSLDYKPEYSSIELGVDEISLEPSSKTRPRFMKPGREPGPDGDGK